MMRKLLTALTEKFKERPLELGTLIAFILAVLLFQAATFSDFQSLPAPLYGGDFYYQMGVINGVRNTWNPLDGVSIPGATPSYLPMYSTLVAYYANIFGLSTIDAMYQFSLIITAASILLFYWLGRELFKDEFALLVPVFAYVMLLLTIKYSPFTYMVVVPVYLVFLYRFFFVEISYRNAAYLGLAIGALALSHAVVFIQCVLIFILFLIYKIVAERLWRIPLLKRSAARIIIACLIVAAFSFVIALPQWYKPFFVFGGASTPEFSHWNSRDLSAVGQQFGYLFTSFLFGDLINWGSWYTKISTVLLLAGIATLLLTRNRSKEASFILVLAVAYAIVKNHYFVSEALLGTHFVPDNMPNLVNALLMVYGLWMLARHFLSSQAAKYAASGILVIFFIFQFVLLNSNYAKDGYMENAKNPLPAHYLSLQDYLEESSEPNDVILTTNELGFAVNAVSGRKLVIARRGHNAGFLDLDPRNIDSAIILYGNSEKARKELIRKYGIRYVYWDYYWMQSEYHINNGQVTSWFDPMLAMYSEDYQSELEKHNVSFFRKTTWIDPALRQPQHKQLDLLFISPQNYRPRELPWDEDLDSLLKEVWSYQVNGRKAAILFEIVA
jgi:hypothetical protein